MSNVCYRCFDDRDLREMIRFHNGPRGCSFCGRRDAFTMPFDDLADFIRTRIDTFYSKAADELPYESAEGGYQGWTADAYDLVKDVIGIDLPRDRDGRLFRTLVHALGDEVWCEFDWLVLEPDESLRFSWKTFCDTVKHHRRYFFHNIGSENARDPDSRSPAELLTEVCRHAQRQGLVIEMPPGLTLYRARPRAPRKPHVTPASLGPPPSQYATQSNRMNPPGIPMFYGADRKALATAEIRDSMASVGRFETTRSVRILDLAHLPAIPGFFSEAYRYDRLMPLFLRDFANLIIEPVERTDRVNIDYIPTQVFTEFLRDFAFEGGKIDGLRYRSATGEKGSNYVLFADQTDIFDCVEPGPFEQFKPWLRLVDVSQMRGK